MNAQQYVIWQRAPHGRETYELKSDTEVMFFPSRAYFSVIGTHIYFEGYKPLIPDDFEPPPDYIPF